jgi:hypothetical protein
MQIRIKIDDALAVLRKNLSEHIAEVAEARAGWIEQMIAALKQFRDAIDRRGLDASHNELYHLMHSRPVDYRSRYSRFIGALELSLKAGDSHMTIDEDDYDRMFNDNWDWRVQSRSTNAGYTKPK